MSTSFVILDSRVNGYTALLANLSAGTDYLVLDPTRDGVEQLVAALAEKSNVYDSLQIFSHGAPGVLTLGNTVLDYGTLTAYAGSLSAIRSALSLTGDIMLYGCNVGASDVGQQFVATLADLTGADVAASDDLTGAAALGGDWALEVLSGVVESVPMIVANFEGVMAENVAPTFGVGDGKITTALGVSMDKIYSVTTQSDNKIIVAGSAVINNSNDFAIVRYNSDGSLDTTFDGDGKVTTDFDSIYDYGKSIIVQNDGKIVIVGEGDDNFAIVRYNGDGSLDTTFDGDGKVTTDFVGYNDIAYDVTVQNNGKIIVVGNTNTGRWNDFALARYNSDGSLDTTFSDDGKVIIDLGYSDAGRSVTMQSDGKILIAGSIDSGGYNYDFVLMRYNSNGSLDTTFSDDGIVSTNFISIDFGYSVTMQNDGKIIMVGYADSDDTIADTSYDFALARYNSDGSLDTTFGDDGKITTDFATLYDYGQSVVMQNDGKIIVAGCAFINGNEEFALARYNSDGSLDTTFSGDGKITTYFANDFMGDSGDNSVTMQSDGKIIVAGSAHSPYTGTDFAIARYNSDGSLDTTFDSNILNGTPTYNVGGRAVILDNDVQIYDAELAALGNYSGATLTLARHNSASIDDRFSGAGIVAGQANGAVTVASTNIGTYSWENGTLAMNFNSAATQSLVNQAMQSMAYQNFGTASETTTVQIDWIFNDGDSSGALSTMGNTTVTIVDTTVPTLTTSTPSDNATDVAIDSNIALTFDENVQAGTGNIVITNGTDIRMIDVTNSTQVTFDGKTVTINPSEDLQTGSNYHIVIDNSAITDLADNSFAGITNADTLDFVTAIHQGNGQQLHFYNNHYYQLTTSAMTWSQAEAEAVAFDGHLVTINDEQENTWLGSTFCSTYRWIGLNDIQQEGNFVWVDGSPVTYTNWSDGEPNVLGDEDGGEIYTPSLAAKWNDINVLKSQYGIIEYAINGSIQDIIAPILISSTPSDNATAVAVDSNITLTFDEGVQVGTDNIIITDGTDIRTINVTDTTQVAFSGNTIIINPIDDLHAGKEYHVEVANSNSRFKNVK